MESEGSSMNLSKNIKPNALSEEERKQFNKEMMIIVEKYSKEEIEMALHQLKKKAIIS